MSTPLWIENDAAVPASTSTGTFTLTVATNANAGDRLVALVTENDNQLDDVTITPPAGFVPITFPDGSEVVRLATGHAALKARVYVKLSATAGQSVAFTFSSPSGAIYPSLVVDVVRNAHATNPTDPGTENDKTGSANLLTLVSGPTTRADVLWLAYFASGNKDLHSIPAGDTSGFTLSFAGSSGGSAAPAKIAVSALRKTASAIGETASPDVQIAGGSNHNYIGLVIGISGTGGGGGGGGGAAAATAHGMTPTDDGKIHRGLSGHYDGDIPNLATAQRIAANFDIDVANVDTNPSTGAITTDRFQGFLDEMRLVNPSFKAAPYTKGPQINEGVSYYPNDYYSHVCPWPSGAKITTFSASIYVAQPVVAAGQSAFVDPRGWTAHSFKEQRARDSWGIVDRYNTVMGAGMLDAVYADSMGTSSYKGTNCNPDTGSLATKAEWLDFVQQIGDELRSRSSGRLVLANGLISGASYYGSGGGQDLLNHVDGGLAENWYRNNFGAASAFHTEAGFRQDLDMVKDANDRGKMFWGVVNLCNDTAGSGTCSFTAAQIEQWWRYSTAAYLLSNCGWSLFEFRTFVPTVKGWDEDHPYLHVDLGAPIDAQSFATGKQHTEPSQPAGNATYVYRRRYTNGCAYVNPGTAPVKITLDRDYRDPVGIGSALYAAGSTLTLAAQSGLILRTQAATGGNAGAPVVTITGPATSVQTAAVTATATVTDADGVASAEVSLNGGAYQPMTLAGGVWSRALTLASGANTLSFRATDTNASPLTSTPVTRTVTYTPNAAAPSVTINAPATSVAAGVQLVQATATDADGVASAEVMINGGSWVALTFNAVSGKWERSVTLLEGTNDLQVRATDLHPEPRTSTPVQRTVTVTTAQPDPGPTPGTDPDPNQIPNLGTGKWHVALLERGGVVLRTAGARRFDAWSSLTFNRDPNGTAEAQLVINGADKVAACAQVLADARAWKHELGFYRETAEHPGGRLEWVGPITRIQLPPGGTSATISARDLSMWLSRRLIHNDHDYAGTGVDIATIAIDLVTDAMAPDTSPHLTPTGQLVGRIAARTYAAAAHLMADKALADLDSAGLRWTTIRRQLRIMPITPAPVTTLLDEHFAGGIGEDDDGLAMATLWGARGAGGGETDTIYAEAAAPPDALSTYGLLEQVADANEIATLDDAQAYVAQLAASSSSPAQMIQGGALTPRSPMTFDLLVPHTSVKVVKALGVRPFVQERIIARITVSATPAGEQVAISFEGQTA